MAFKAEYLRSTGQYTGEEPFKRGTVVSVKDLGLVTIARVDWGDGEEPQAVAAKNLAKVTSRGVCE